MFKLFKKKQCKKITKASKDAEKTNVETNIHCLLRAFSPIMLKGMINSTRYEQMGTVNAEGYKISYAVRNGFLQIGHIKEI